MSLLTQADLADDVFRVPEKTVADWHRRYSWPHVRIGRRIYYTPDQLAEILRRQSVAPKKKPGISGQTERSAARGAA